VAARLAAVAALGLAVARAGAARSRRPGGAWLVAAAGVGAVDALGNLAYAAATTGGALATVTLIAAAYPAVTVLLAAVLLGQRITPLRAGGVVATVAGLGLLAA
jgi:drug/metabolite transporter (DMT)-like permease